MIGYIRVDGAMAPIDSIEVDPEGLLFRSKSIYCWRDHLGPVEVLSPGGEVMVVGTQIIDLPRGECSVTYLLRITDLKTLDGTILLR